MDADRSLTAPAAAAGRPRLPRTLLSAAIALIGLIALWAVLSRVLATDRGLELTDEGLHLLSLDPPPGQVGFQYPFGWSTSPLFPFVGYDIAGVRTLAATILVSLSGLLGWLAARLIERTASVPGAATDARRRAIVPWVVGGTAAMASLLLYSWFLRTPDYNWATLVGIELALVGLIVMISPGADDTRPVSRSGLVGALLAALGAVVTVPARPSTWAALLLVLAVVLPAWRPWRTAAALWASVVLGMVVVALGAVALGRWPTDVVSIAATALRQPTVTVNSTVSGALSQELAVPYEFLRSLWMLPREIKYPVIAAWLVMALLAVMRRPPRWLIAPVVLVAALLARSVQVDGTFERLAAISTAEGALLVTAGLVLLGCSRHPGAGTSSRPAGRGRVLLLAAGFVALAFAFGFGSMADPYALAARAGVLPILAVTSILQLGRPVRLPMLAIVACWTAVVCGTTLQAAWQHPLNLAAPISEQTVPVAIGPRGSELLLDASTAGRLTDIKDAALAGGWAPGTPLLGVAWQWASTIPYDLGAKVPPFLMPTILYANDGALDLLDHHLAQLPCDPWGEAWVLTSTPGANDPDAGNWFDPAAGPSDPWLGRAVQSVTAHFGRTLAEDYTLVAQSHGLELWKPLTGAVADDAACTAG